MLRIINDMAIVMDDINAGSLVLYRPLKLSEIKKKIFEIIIQPTFHYLIL